MTRFNYAEYIALFRSSDTKRHSSQKSSSTSSSSGREEPIEPVCDDPSDGWTPLHRAALRGHTHDLRALLRDGRVCVDRRTLQEQTALLLAVQGRHLECVRILLEAGADPDISDKHKETPLYTACEQACVSVVELLLECGAAVDQRCAGGGTALHAAARGGHTEICQRLLRAGAGVDSRTSDGLTPAVQAARHGHTHTLALLIQNGCGVNLQTSDGNTALSEASRRGHTETVRLLLRHNADANRASSSGLLPLHEASQHGHHETVCVLLPVSSRSRVLRSGVSPLHLAAGRGHERVLRALLQWGCEVNRLERSSSLGDGCVSALSCAVAAGHTRAAAVLLRAGAAPDLGPVSPLLLVARQGRPETVALLLESGAHADPRPAGHSAAFPAALLYVCELDVLRLLLAHGCGAHACFSCDAQHRTQDPQDTQDTGPGQHIRTGPQLQFCEWLCSSRWSPSAGRLLDLLLEYVGNVRLCSRITHLLLDKPEWPSIRQKTSCPRSLLHLCRLRIRGCLRAPALRAVPSLPLPPPLLRYLTTLPPHTHTHSHTHTPQST